MFTFGLSKILHQIEVERVKFSRDSSRKMLNILEPYIESMEKDGGLIKDLIKKDK